ncbi:DEAD/DEAH box helicase, partial [Xylariaceae sp. FL0016]
MAHETKVPKKDARAWDSLTGLPEWIKTGVSSMGFAKSTPVQASVWPLFGVGNKDVVVEAVTGSGKTYAFLMPLCHRLLRQEEPNKRHTVAAICVAPTRELAAQIHGSLTSLIAFHPPSAEMLPYLSGDEKRPQTSEPAIVPQLLSGGSTTTVAQDLSFFLRHSPNVIISTPGRLVELLASPHVHCPQSSFECLILDEADRLLDLGFKTDLQSILSRLPKQRRTGLFSASMSEAVDQVIRAGLRNPVKIQVRVKNLKTGGTIEERRTPASLQMSYLVTPAHQKWPTLVQLLESLDPRPLKSIVYLSTCASVDYFSEVLPQILPEGYLSIPLHGKYDAKVRDKNFTRFTTSTQPAILLTTDVAARGLDFPQVDLVVQIDAPQDPKTFLHRCGRAGRAGRKGLSVIFLQPHETDYVPFLDVRKTPITPLSHPEISVTEDEAKKTTETIRTIVKSDRALYDKAQKAFVSSVRSYSKHTASSIFSMSDLDWKSLGDSWGLLRLPKMPEAKRWDGDRSLGVTMDWDSFAYASKQREKQRQQALEAERSPAVIAADAAKVEAREVKRKRNQEAWSAKHEQEETRVSRRDKKKRKKDAERTEKMSEADNKKENELQQLLAEVRRRNMEKYASERKGDHRGDDAGDGGDFEGF